MKKALAAAVLLAACGAAHLKWRAYVAKQQFTFVDVPEGARAPTSADLGFTVGHDSLAEVALRTAALGLQCQDDGMSALVQRAVAAEVADRRAKGELALGHRLYGWLNPHGQNPQVRWSCEDSDARLLGRQGPKGRLLFVFDAPWKALRHVSFAQRYTERPDAERDYLNAGVQLGARFAPDAALPKPPSKEPFAPARVAYRFADREAKVAFVDLGRAVTVTESVEVPFPVRVE